MTETSPEGESTPDNLPERLKWFHSEAKTRPHVLTAAPLMEAADEIERLRSLTSPLPVSDDAVEMIARVFNTSENKLYGSNGPWEHLSRTEQENYRFIARAVLSSEPVRGLVEALKIAEPYAKAFADNCPHDDGGEEAEHDHAVIVAALSPFKTEGE